MPRIGASDLILLLYRFVLAATFVVIGWERVCTAQISPSLLAAVITIEISIGCLVMVGAVSSVLPFVLSLYSFASAFLGHNYWDYVAADQHTMSIFFYKNLILACGFFALTITGPGALSFHALMERKKKVNLWS